MLGSSEAEVPGADIYLAQQLRSYQLPQSADACFHQHSGIEQRIAIVRYRDCFLIAASFLSAVGGDIR